ncbi:MAG: DUF1952 domain-containing protein [Anaerolineales bacterium]|nr:DUF1952 domain-containing protein [Anaerolineales bacterium]
MQTIVHEMRGIPLWLLREYLEEMGGVADGEERLAGAGWRVQLTRLEPLRIGSLSVGQVRVALEIEDHLADDFQKRFAKKTLRAGG